MTTHTEDEAKQLWCPFARAVVVEADMHKVLNQTSFNRMGLEEAMPQVPRIPQMCFCIASQCMAWRWDMRWASQTEEGQGGDVVLRLKRLEGEPKRGYCGLAGP